MISKMSKMAALTCIVLHIHGIKVLICCLSCPGKIKCWRNSPVFRWLLSCCRDLLKSSKESIRVVPRHLTRRFGVGVGFLVLTTRFVLAPSGCERVTTCWTRCCCCSNCCAISSWLSCCCRAAYCCCWVAIYVGTAGSVNSGCPSATSTVCLYP